MLENTFERLEEKYAFISSEKRLKYHVLLHYTRIFSDNQHVVLIYYSKGKSMFLQYCYPLTETQYYILKQKNIKGIASKSMNSGYEQYKNCWYVYANIKFSIDDEIKFDEAFGYLVRQLELLLKNK